MASGMFDNVLDPGRRTSRKSRVLPVSIGVHAAALAGVMVLPLFLQDLPEPHQDSVVRAFFVEPIAPAPPPPPPPPAAAAAPRPAVVPKVEKPKIEKPVVQKQPEFTAPIEVPDKVEPVKFADAGALAGVGSPDIGVPGGVAGGVEGGVVGGVEGGVEGGVPGGVVGGIEGGVPGGVVGGVIGGVPDAPPPPKPQGPVRVGGSIKPPRKISDAAPDYPDVARAARVQGVVILEATIGPDGSVDRVSVLRGVPLLNDAAASAVRKWRYTPTLLNGVPVPVIMTVTVNFTLS